MLGIGLGVGAVASGSGGGFVPTDIFTGGAVGAWYDPSDITTMFQDSAGTTPVTSYGQPVGKILDKSGNGNHLIQSVSINRPMLDARLNIIDANSDALTTQTVTTFPNAQTLSFTGTGSVALSGVHTDTLNGTGANDRVSLTFTPSAGGSLTLTVTGTVTFAQLELGNAFTVYQRVTTTTDYADVGVPRYLKFDGTNSYLVSASTVDFTSVNEINLFCGARKNSDSATAKMIVELSQSVGSYNGSFQLTSPQAGSDARFSVKGTIQQTVSKTSVSGAVRFVATCNANISTPITTLRWNGVAGTPNTSNLGTGNFGNYNLYVGKRNGASFPWDGRLNQLCIRGGALTNAQITAMESYINNKMVGVY